MRISNSFSEGEIQMMDFILSTLLRGGSPQMATRNKDFASLCRKVVAMKAKVAETKRKEARGQRPVPAESSVGAIDAAEVVDDADEAVEDVG
ncbi:MAG: hypothetical protein AB7S26_28785 [Sandaracinaceae bacterium]